MGVLYLVGRGSPLAQEDRRGRRRNVEISVAILEKLPSRGLPRATAPTSPVLYLRIVVSVRGYVGQVGRC
jgi:hypothetical protein